MDRLTRKLTRENLWLYILSLLLKGSEYAYAIPDAIEKEFGWRPARITGYIVLKTLNMKGCVSVVERKGETGKMRRYYDITDQGVGLFQEAKEFLGKTYQDLFAEAPNGPNLARRSDT